MFPTRATGQVQGPTAADVQAYAARHHLVLDDAAAAGMAAAVTAGLASFDRIDELDAPSVELKHTTRDPGRPPVAGEDPYNAVIRFCRVEGDPDPALPLAGRTLAVKDCIAVAGIPTTNGGRRVPYAVPTEDAVVIERLLDAGVTITMKTNLEDMALGLGEGSFFGAARNPHDPRFATGGSSSGSGAAVAAGMVDLALGADEAGSVRIPAAWCGLVGMKATHGLVPSYGLSYMDHTLDHIGPMTRTVADNATMLEVMAGHDWRDPQWVRAAPTAGAYSAQAGQTLEGLRIGVLTEALAPVGCTEDTLDAFAGARATLEELGAEVVDVSVPLWPDAFTIEAGMIYAALHDMHVSGGQGIGHLGRIDVEAMAAATASGRLGAVDLPPMLKMALVTTEFLRDKYLGVHIGKAHNLRLELRRQVTAALAGVDLLITPTIPHVATELLDRPALPGEMAERVGLSAVANTCALDLTGHPGLSIPCGTGAHGLPIGLQLVGPHFGEEVLYRAAFAFEAARGVPEPPTTQSITSEVPA